MPIWCEIGKAPIGPSASGHRAAAPARLSGVAGESTWSEGHHAKTAPSASGVKTYVDWTLVLHDGLSAALYPSVSVAPAAIGDDQE